MNDSIILESGHEGYKTLNFKGLDKLSSFKDLFKCKKQPREMYLSSPQIAF